MRPHRQQPTRLPIPGIFQARTLEWVAISFSNAWKWSHSVGSISSWPHGLQPTRLLCPWDFPGKSTGVGCHCLWQFVFWLRMTVFPTSLLTFFLFETDLWVKSGRYSFTFNKYSLFHQVKILKALLTLESTRGRWSLVSLTKLSGVKMGGCFILHVPKNFYYSWE